MNDNRLVGLLLVLAALPGLAWAWSDYRSGTVRLVLFSRRCGANLVHREADPRRFCACLGFNVLLFALMVAGGVFLMVKP
ncbi:hypothetical protein [Novosphingobium beihaiensis]|uniref:Uncharacterized protein n=1 Tax=Novosphingobium beihaiensis TaxID=2930389 RepID=A0ABT0BNK2_9SPHN|nr:hypothetical protein [Novosphingobium beihaiensis]MCJ2186624.1 hypothetical protein [Novosphingobium beihaiensis]